MSEIWLARLRLNPRNSAVQRDLVDCRRLHQRVMAAFPDGIGPEARASLNVLYRPEGDPRAGTLDLIVQSGAFPDWGRLPAPVEDGAEPYLRPGFRPEQKRIDDALAAIAPETVLRFRLRANPTKRLPATPEGEAAHPLAGKRVGLMREEQQRDWLLRRLREGGAVPIDARVGPDLLVVPQRERSGGSSVAEDRRLTFQAVRYDGLLRVTDADAFRELLVKGVGSGKAYGFGLLSVARAG